MSELESLPKPMTGADFFNELGAGSTSKRFMQEVQETTARVHDTGGDGTVTLTVKIVKSEDRVKYTPSVKSNPPKREQMPTSFFFKEDHKQILREDPNQPELVPIEEQRPSLAKA